MGAVQGIVLSVARSGEEVVIAARGQLDFATKTELTETITAACGDAVKSCVLDFDLVSFIDSESLKSLIEVQETLSERGQSLSIARCSSQVDRTLTLIGLHERFEGVGSPAQDARLPYRKTAA